MLTRSKRGRDDSLTEDAEEREALREHERRMKHDPVYRARQLERDERVRKEEEEMKAFKEWVKDLSVLEFAEFFENRLKEYLSRVDPDRGGVGLTVIESKQEAFLDGILVDLALKNKIVLSEPSYWIHDESMAKWYNFKIKQLNDFIANCEGKCKESKIRGGTIRRRRRIKRRYGRSRRRI